MGSSKLGLMDDLIMAGVFMLAMVGAFHLVDGSAHGFEHTMATSFVLLGLYTFFLRRLSRYQTAREPIVKPAPYDLSSWEAGFWGWLEPADSFLATLRNGALASAMVLIVSGLGAFAQGNLQWERLFLASLSVGCVVTLLGMYRVIQARRSQRA